MIPDKIKIKTQSHLLQLTFGTQEYELSFEFLRVHSPSAEVRGHGEGNKKLQYGKQEVILLDASYVGNYALKLKFDDGHDTGLYDWNYLYYLCQNQQQLWQVYLQELKEKGKTRSSASIAFKAL